MPYDEDIDDEGDYYDEDDFDDEDSWPEGDELDDELDNPPDDDDEPEEESLDDLTPDERAMYEDFLGYAESDDDTGDDAGELPDPGSDDWESFDWDSYDWIDYTECEVGIHYGEFS